MRKTQLKQPGALTILSILFFTGVFICFQETTPVRSAERLTPANRKGLAENHNQVLEWNQIFIDTLIATNTANSSSQRLGAIVHTAIFDAYNGIERRYTPIFIHDEAPRGASRRAAVIAAAYTALVGLFPSRQTELADSYAASLASLSNGDGGESRERGIAWGTEVAQAVLAWRATDGFGASYPPFTGGTAVGQWRPTPPAFGAMSAQGLAFTEMFVLDSNTQFRPGPPRNLTNATYPDDFNAVKALGRSNGSTRTPDQTALALFWEGNASIHWNQAANQMALANHLSISKSNRLLAVLNIAMADTAFTTWSGKRFYGADPNAVTWRPVTSIPLAETDGNPDTTSDPGWLPLINTPSHPEYPAGHPSLNGSAATVLLSHFDDEQTFTLTTIGQPSRTYTSIAQARSDGNNARVWGGMHYPSTVDISDAVGEAIAYYVNLNSMQRLHGGGMADEAPFFVRQHYLDFLNRPADDLGLAFWTNQIIECGTDANCLEGKRVHVSAAFFLSIEFHETGYLVHRMYKAAYGDIGGTPVPLTRQEFLPDTQRVAQGVVVGASGWELALENNKSTFASEFVARSRFTTAFPQTMTSEQFVDALNANAGGALSQAEREQLVSELASGTKTRAQVLRSVAEDDDLERNEFNKAFALMQYFGYLHRNPNDPPDADFSGYNFWLNKLNLFGGNFANAEMVKAFITSIEYRQRFDGCAGCWDY